MLKSLGRSVLLLSLAAALGCAHKNPPPDFAYDHAASFAGLKTYAWFDDPNWVMPQGNSIIDGQFIDRNVRAGRQRHAAEEGLRAGRQERQLLRRVPRRRRRES